MNQVQQELSTILFSEIGDVYYDNPEFQLAPKTFSARAFSYISYASVNLHKKSPRNCWQARLIHSTIDVATGTLYAVNCLLALAESVGALALTALFIRFQASKCLGTYALKSLSCALHSLIIIKVQIQAMYTMNFSRFYSGALIDSQISHHLAAASALWLILHSQKNTNRLDELDRIPFISAVRLFVTKKPMVDLLRALHKDFNPGLSDEDIERQIHSQSLIAFIAYRPEVFEFIKEWCEDLDRIKDSQFQKRLRDIAADFVQFSQNNYLLRPQGNEPEMQIIHSVDARDGIYQKKLQNFVKDSFLEIYKIDSLARCLSAENTPQAGRDALESYSADIYLSLANYAQLKELEASEVVCPEKFHTRELQAKYSGRHIHIMVARKLLEKITAEDRNVLINSLISSKGPQANPSLETLFKNICALAGSLHGGTLMSQQTIQERTAHVSSINLFQKACMDAMSLIK